MFENRRVYLLTAVAYMGAMLFGFDTGVMGSVLAMDSFKNDFGLPVGDDGFSSARNAYVSSNVVSLLTAGSFFGAIAAAFINEKWGRLYTLMGFCFLFNIGAALQTAAHHDIGLIYGGRVISGLGIGGCSAVMSVFVSEAAPPKVRGRIAGLFQEMLVIGSTFAYWLDYGCKLHLPSTTKQWRVPVAMQLVLGGLMFIGLFFLKESPRWLCKKGRHEQALASLAHVRCKQIDSPEVIQEMAEIRASIEEELNATEGVTWKECLTPGNRKRFMIGTVIMFWQQFSGTNSIGYYAPQIMQTVGLSAADSSMFATGIYGTVKVIATGIFLYVGIDQFGRKKSLIAGGFWMSSMMFIIGAVLATHPPDPSQPGVSQASIAMVALIYLYVIGYSASWGPVPWVLVSEIFPTRLRAYGVGLAAATQWLFNFVVTKITPSAINSIGWRTFLMFAIFCLAMAVFVWIFVPETKQLTLEEIDVVFGAVSAETRAKDVELAIEVEKSKAGVDHEEGDENVIADKEEKLKQEAGKA